MALRTSQGSCFGSRLSRQQRLLLHLEKPHKVWPKSIEAQLFHPDAGHLIAIQGAKFQGQKDATAQKQALKPVGEWNQQTVVCRDGAITCEINGVEVSRGTDAVPDRGFIGWQSEGTPVRFRNLKISKTRLSRGNITKRSWPMTGEDAKTPAYLR